MPASRRSVLAKASISLAEKDDVHRLELLHNAFVLPSIYHLADPEVLDLRRTVSQKAPQSAPVPGRLTSSNIGMVGVGMGHLHLDMYYVCSWRRDQTIRTNT